MQRQALELWHQAAELGNADAVCNVANAYRIGSGVEVDEKKAEYYAELAAIGRNICKAQSRIDGGKLRQLR